MSLFDTNDGLLLTQEGANTRARCGRLNFLFRDRSPETVLKEYRESVARTRSWFRPRWNKIPPGEVTEENFADLTQEIALHWMYFYIVNRLIVNVTNNDMDHPQSTDMIWRFFKRKCGEESPEVNRLASVTAGMSESAFEKWLAGWKLYLDR